MFLEKRFYTQLLTLTIMCAPAAAEVNFAEFAVTQVSSELQLRNAAGADSTAQIAGVAAYPAVDGPVYAVHVDTSQKESFLRVDATNGVGTKLSDSIQVSVDLGVPYTQTLTLTGGFAYSVVDNRIYFAENFNGTLGEVSLIGINASTGVAGLVARSFDLEGLNDHAILPNGHIVGARGEDGNRTIGTIDPATGAWIERLNEADLLAASPGSTELPPEAIGANSDTGELFVFCHDDLDLFSIADVTVGSPAITRLTQPELATVDLHDIAVDQGGNMFGFDEAGEQIIIIRSSDSAIFTVSFEKILADLGGAAAHFSPALWRGTSARAANRGQVDLFLASSTADYGIVRVRFGDAPAAVDGWELY